MEITVLGAHAPTVTKTYVSRFEPSGCSWGTWPTAPTGVRCMHGVRVHGVRKCLTRSRSQQGTDGSNSVIA